jgi:hypothetical protein
MGTGLTTILDHELKTWPDRIGLRCPKLTESRLTPRLETLMRVTGKTCMTKKKPRTI